MTFTQGVNMSTELRVLGAHLDELAATQGAAAAVIRSATAATDGVDDAVGATHGTISAATSAAVAAAVTARREAGTRVAQVTRDVQDRLRESAASYTGADETAGAAIGGVLGRR
jgi:hypothetical protein